MNEHSLKEIARGLISALQEYHNAFQASLNLQDFSDIFICANNAVRVGTLIPFINSSILDRL